MEHIISADSPMCRASARKIQDIPSNGKGTRNDSSAGNTNRMEGCSLENRDGAGEALRFSREAPLKTTGERDRVNGARLCFNALVVESLDDAPGGLEVRVDFFSACSFWDAVSEPLLPLRSTSTSSSLSSSELSRDSELRSQLSIIPPTILQSAPRRPGMIASTPVVCFSLFLGLLGTKHGGTSSTADPMS